MKSRLIAAALLLTIAACSSSEVVVPPEPERPVEERLVEAYVEAQGGLVRIRAITTLEMEGEVEIPAMGMKLPLVLKMKRPTMMFTEVDVAAAGIIVTSAYDGETAWTNNPMLGSEPVKLGGAQARQLRDQSDIDGILVNYRDKGYELAYEGEEEVRGHTTNKLRVKRPDGTTALVYMDSETSTIVRVDSDGINPTTGVPAKTQTYFEDYREVQGVKMAFRIEAEINGKAVQKLAIDSIHANRPMDDSLFEFPGGSH